MTHEILLIEVTHIIKADVGVRVKLFERNFSNNNEKSITTIE